MALSEGENGEDKPKIIAIGKKTIEFFEKRGFDIVGKYPLLAETAKTFSQLTGRNQLHCLGDLHGRAYALYAALYRLHIS